jgi:hypothetical protein
MPAEDRQRVFAPLQLPAADDQARQASDDFVRDVIKYFGLGYAAKVQVPFIQLLTEQPLIDGLMVVSHSFGTLIAYGVLVHGLGQINEARRSAGKPEIHVDTLVTMGSPLGWAHDLQQMFPVLAQELLVRSTDVGPEVEQVLSSVEGFVGGIFHHSQAASPAPMPGQIPAMSASPMLYELPPKMFPPESVDRWFNIFDPRDPVSGEFGLGALTVADTFLYGQSGAAYERAFDVPIKNDFAPMDSWSITLDAHNDRGYGQCAQLAQLVHDFWFRWQQPAEARR